MRHTSYITHEKKRSRYVFQIRIPAEVRSRFGNRTLIRIALGRVSAGEAQRQGAALAEEWQAKFQKARGIRIPVRQLEIITLKLDTDTQGRAAATWRAARISQLEERIGELRQLSEAEWEAELLAARNAFGLAKRACSRGSSSDAEQALDELSERFGVRFKAQVHEIAEWAEVFAAESVRFSGERMAVLEGEMPLNAIQVAPESLLPLVRFFGTRARELEQHRVMRLGSIGKLVRPKTHAKFVRIASQLDEIIGERPVECLKPQDVSQLLELWRKDGNATTTIVDKLSILVGLLQPISPAAAAICKKERPATNLNRARRHPLSPEQLASFRQYVETHKTHPNDARLLELMLLTGARLGEVLQLAASDIRRTDKGYVVSLWEESALKTLASVRDLPIQVEGMPELKDWLEGRLEAQGPLFPDARADRHGHFGNAESKRLNKTLRKNVTANRRVVLQSTRNTVGRALRRADVDPRVRRRYLGHVDLDIHDRHYDPAELLGADDLMAVAPVLNQLALSTRPGRVLAEARARMC
ncbi:MAG: tyrosine-type recombinase/integrase [Gallionellaceae bacterium]|nr:tyrosine-type recombinase/integrase [Gallionellaceae bacterium]